MRIRNEVARWNVISRSKRWNAYSTVAITSRAVTTPVAKIVSASLTRTLIGGREDARRKRPAIASPRRLAHLVAGASHGEDQLRPHRVGLELRAQPVDVRRHGVLVTVVRVAPHRVEQLRAREHVPGMAREVQQEVELERREVDRMAAVADLALGRLHLEIAVADRLRLRLRIGTRRAQQVGAPQQRLDAGEQLGERERLGQVVVGTELEAEHTVELG